MNIVGLDLEDFVAGGIIENHFPDAERRHYRHPVLCRVGHDDCVLLKDIVDTLCLATGTIGAGGVARDVETNRVAPFATEAVVAYRPDLCHIPCGRVKAGCIVPKKLVCLLYDKLADDIDMVVGKADEIGAGREVVDIEGETTGCRRTC